MGLNFEEIRVDGQAIDPVLTGSITSANLSRRIDGATRLTLGVYDPRMDLLRSGALTRPRTGKQTETQKKFEDAAWDRFSAMRLTLDGISFLLAGGGFTYDAQTRETRLTFEDELAERERRMTKALKVSRGDGTRAEFHGLMVRRTLAGADVPFSRALADRFFSPQAGQREPIAEPKDDDERQKGFGNTPFDIKTERADSEQKAVLTEALTEADRLKAGERASLALIVTLITEKECRNTPGGDADSSGAFQVQARTAAVAPKPTTIVDPRSGNVHGSVAPRTIARGPLNPLDVTECTRYFMLHGFAADTSGAIKYAADHPDAEPWAIAQAMQGSGAGRASNGEANYGPWLEQAKEILDAWGGAGQTHTIRESYEFRAGGRRNGKASNYWADSGDSAEEVRWRRFCDRNRHWFVPDEWLFERKPVIVVDGADGPEGLAEQGIIGLDTTGFDVGLPSADIMIRCFLPRWSGAPGATVLLRNLGPLDGKWLIGFNDQDIYLPLEISTLTLVRPQPKKKEPAPKTNTVVQTETLPESGSPREAIVAAAEKAEKLKANYFYRQSRPMHDSLFENQLGAGLSGPVQPMGIDCSEFVTLVYKAAGVPDPNGSGYDGQGYTGTLRANGKKTNDPQPGDLVHWGSGGAGGASHVGIYVGNGEAIHMGSDPGPLRDKVSEIRNDFAGYWQHDLTS